MHGCGDIDAARAAEEEAFLAQQAVHVADRFRILDMHCIIGGRVLHVRRDATDTDAFRDRARARRLQRAIAHELIETAAGRIGQHAADGAPPRLQVPGDAGEGAAGARGDDEGVQAARGLLPDLRSGRLDMCLPVGGVVELIGPDGARQARSQPLRHFLVLVGIAVGDRRHLVDFGAEHFEQPVFLRRLVVRHHDDTTIAARVADVGEAYPGVARRTLDDDAAGDELAAVLRAEHDRARRTILDGSAGVHELRFAEYFAAGLFAHPPQPDQRRIADGPDETLAHAGSLPVKWAGSGPPRSRSPQAPAPPPARWPRKRPRPHRRSAGPEARRPPGGRGRRSAPVYRGVPAARGASRARRAPPEAYRAHRPRAGGPLWAPVCPRPCRRPAFGAIAPASASPECHPPEYVQ